MKTPNVMIFAAGFGTRMRPLTETMPKALVPLAGRPLIDHALDQARATRPQRIVVNGHHHADQLRAHLQEQADVTFIEEHGQPLETGGGLRAALTLLGAEPVMTLNSDAAWTGPPAAHTLIQAWDPTQMDALLLVVPTARTCGTPGGWRFALNDGQLARADQGLIYTGAAIVKTQGLATIEQEVFSLLDLWRPMLEAGRLGGVIHPVHWADVGTPAGIPLAEAMLASASV